MMKKIEYQAPEMEVLEFKYQGILCESPTQIVDDNIPGLGGDVPTGKDPD